jgi:site-specific DNA recombinase
MQGSWNHDQPYYRCRYPTEHALPRGTQHQKVVYVREAQIVPPLDDWIAGVFEPERLEETCRALADAHEPATEEDGRAEAALRTLADCDARLARYRQALEAGTDPAVVTSWIAEVEAERRSAEEELPRPVAAFTEDDIRAMVESLGDLVGVLRAADRRGRPIFTTVSGSAFTYEPSKRRVLMEADLGRVRPVRVGGPKSPNCHPGWRLRPWRAISR